MEEFENVPLDSSQASAVVDIVSDGKIVEGTKASVITNTLMEFACESLSHEDFFLNSKDNFGKHLCFSYCQFHEVERTSLK